MAQQGGADHIVNGNEGEDDNGLFIIGRALRRRFPLLGEDFNTREFLNDLKARACALKRDFIREKTAYEADPQNQADKFAFHLNLFNIVLDSLRQEVYDYELEFDRYIADNPRPEGTRYCDPMKDVTLILYEVIDMIGETWSRDLEERVGRQKEREIIQVVEGLPTMKIPENPLNENVCAICLSDFEETSESCHLRCDERHVFHRQCIKEWLKRQNQCPTCRWPAYMWTYCREVFADEDIGRLRFSFHV